MLCLSFITCDPFRQLFHPFLNIAFFSLLFRFNFILNCYASPFSCCSVISYKIHLNPIYIYFSFFTIYLILLSTSSGQSHLPWACLLGLLAGLQTVQPWFSRLSRIYLTLSIDQKYIYPQSHPHLWVRISFHPFWYKYVSVFNANANWSPKETPTSQIHRSGWYTYIQSETGRRKCVHEMFCRFLDIRYHLLVIRYRFGNNNKNLPTSSLWEKLIIYFCKIII